MKIINFNASTKFKIQQESSYKVFDWNKIFGGDICKQTK